MQGREEKLYTILSWLDNLKDKDYLEDPGIFGRIILKRILQK